ncbi:MAG: hypothetical protein EOO88_01780 [Pedobacter sp.]|nr:MAG: hypothetical protein EOO88_01780 [Pedobacter sp.]
MNGIRQFLKTSIVFLLLFSGLYVNAQQKSVKTIAEDINDYSTAVFREKVYLHLNNSIYAPGDTAWFKGYVVNGENNFPTDKSKILHVDLSDMKGKIKKHIVRPIAFGFSSGDFVLPDSLADGNYVIRAYTNHIKNDDIKAIFSKIIRIADPDSWNKQNKVRLVASRLNSTIEKHQLFVNTVYRMDVNADDPDTLRINLSAPANKLNGEALSFLPLSNGVPLFVFKTSFPDTLVHLSIPKRKLPPGIIQCALFNAAKDLIAEKLIYNRQETAADINLLNLKKSYEAGAPVDLELAVTDKFGRPALGSFSIAVVNSSFSSTNEDQQANMFGNLLLNSNLKTEVKDPNYYFNAPSVLRDRELNELLLNQRSINPDLSKIISRTREKEPQFNQENFEIRGKISAGAKTVVAGLGLTLLTGNLADGILLDTVTNAKGEFVFKLPDSLIYEKFRLDIKGKTSVDYKVLIEGFEPAKTEQQYSEYALIRLNKDSSFTEEQRFKANAAERNSIKLANKKTINLQEVKIYDHNPKPKLAKDSRSWNLNGPGQADQVFTAAFLSKLLSFEQLIPMLKGVNKDMTLVSNHGTNAPRILFIVDGVQGGSVDGINMTDIESLELLKSVEYTGIYGIRGSGGVLIVTTKKPGTGRVAAINQSRIIPAMFDMQRPFYTPSGSAIRGQKDLRTTVFWDANIITAKDGKAKFRFVNSNLLGTHTITIEGISSTGALYSKTFSYEVTSSK